MRSYHYSLFEHDPDRSWVVVGSIQHLTVSLADEVSFFNWADREWPEPRFKVELDPWEISPTLRQ